MSNTVTLRTDGRLFTGWTSVSVTRSIESVAGYFELGVNVPPGTDLSGLAPGKKFTLEIERGRLSAPVISIHGDAR